MTHIWGLDQARILADVLYEMFNERWPEGPYTQKDWAEKCGISASSLSERLSIRKAKGDDADSIKVPRQPSRDTLTKIAHGLTASLPEVEQHSVYDRILAAAGYPSSADQRHPLARELANLLEHLAIPGYIKEGVATDARALLEGWRAYDRARIDLYQRNWLNIIEQCENYRKSLTISPHLLAHWLDISAIAHLHLGKVEDADVLLKHETIQKMLASEEEPYLRASIRLHQGDVFRERGLWSDAKRIYNEAWKVLDSVHDAKVQVRTERKLASVQLYQGDWKEVQWRLQDCLERFYEFDDNYEIARVEQSLGWVCELSGDWKASRQHRERALSLALAHRIDGRHDDNYLVTMSRNHLASDYRQCNELEAAEAEAEEALRLAEAIDAKRYEGYAYLELTHIYRLKGLQALGADPTAHPVRIGEVYACFEKAEAYSKMACDVYPRHYRYYYALALAGRGKLFSDGAAYITSDSVEQNLMTAERALRDAVRVFADLDCHYFEAKTRAHLCELYVQKQENGRSYGAKMAMMGPEMQRIEELHQTFVYPHCMALARMALALNAANMQQMQDASRFCADALYYASAFNRIVLEEMLSGLDRIIRLILRYPHLPEEQMAFLRGSRTVELSSGREYARYFCLRVAEALQKQLAEAPIDQQEQHPELVSIVMRRWSQLN